MNKQQKAQLEEIIESERLEAGFGRLGGEKEVRRWRKEPVEFLKMVVGRYWTVDGTEPLEDGNNDDWGRSPADTHARELRVLQSAKSLLREIAA